MVAHLCSEPEFCSTFLQLQYYFLMQIFARFTLQCYRAPALELVYIEKFYFMKSEINRLTNNEELLFNHSLCCKLQLTMLTTFICIEEILLRFWEPESSMIQHCYK